MPSSRCRAAGRGCELSVAEGGGDAAGAAVMVVLGSVAGTHYVQRRFQIVVLLPKFHRLGEPVPAGGLGKGSWGGAATVHLFSQTLVLLPP